jgi:hypothetical protein
MTSTSPAVVMVNRKVKPGHAAHMPVADTAGPGAILAALPGHLQRTVMPPLERGQANDLAE